MKFVHNDHLGRPEAVTSGNKITVWRAKNYAFDRNVTVDLIGGLDVGFPDQYYDTESDVWSNGFRDYDAKVGRYLQSDPIGLAGGINTYSYVGGNPVSQMDPLGLEAPGSFNNGGTKLTWDKGSGRAPDFNQISVTGLGFSASRYFSRSGKMFAAGGVGTRDVKKPFGLSVSVAAGWLNCSDSGRSMDEQTDDHLGGFGQAMAAGYNGLGGGINYSPGGGTSTLLGAGIWFQIGAGEMAVDNGRWGDGWD